MKLNKLKINGFGKLQDQEIELKDGINIIYGKNETGKSSLLRFISGGLYGISKNKDGKDLPDYDKYTPWNGSDFSGKIIYTLDDGNRYEVMRDFKKRKATVYNKDGEDISNDYSVDKTKGSNFFAEQTGIDETTFMSTAITEQDAVKLSQSAQNNIVQKISNLISTGDDQINFKKAMNDIKAKQNDRVGTERTSQKPLNIVNSKISLLEQKQIELEQSKKRIEDEILNKDQLQGELDYQKSINYFLETLKQCNDNYRVQEAELNASKKLHEETLKKLEQVKAKIDENAEDNIRSQKFKFGAYPFVLFFTSVLCGLALYFVPQEYKLFAAISLVIPFITLAMLLVKRFRYSKSIKNQLEDLFDMQDNIDAQVKILEENLNEQIVDYDAKSNKYNKEIEADRQAIQNDFKNDLSMSYVLEIMALNPEELNSEMAQNSNEIRTLELKLNNINSVSANLNNIQEELTQTEEELKVLYEQKEELMHLNNSFEIAKECLEEAYVDVKKNISPVFMDNLSTTISYITKGKYSNLKLTDDDGLLVEVENGQYLPVNNYLSVGAIDQMYLALRLSSLKEVSQETLPIILDEAFAYFDNERMSNILKFIHDNYDTQVLIFTCSNREKEVLDALKIKYNLIKL